MNRRQQRTLARIFESPSRSDIEWIEVESLLAGYGAEIRQGRGSRVRIILNKQVLNVHTPHQKEVKKYVVEIVKDFLTSAGVTP